MPSSSTFRSLRDCLHCEHRSLGMFCSLDSEALAAFDSLGVHTALQAGTTIFAEEMQVVGVFVLCTGRVKLSCTSKEGKTLILKIAAAGDVLGLGAVISGSRYEVTAETIEPTRLKSIPRSEFLAFIEKHGEASMHAAQVMSHEYRSAFFDVRRLALSVSAAARLASVLLDWGRTSSPEGAQMRFTMSLTHEELANLIGSSRETVTRMLSRFKKDKLIEIHGATMLILAPDKLEQLAA